MTFFSMWFIPPRLSRLPATDTLQDVIISTSGDVLDIQPIAACVDSKKAGKCLYPHTSKVVPNLCGYSPALPSYRQQNDQRKSDDLRMLQGNSTFFAVFPGDVTHDDLKSRDVMNLRGVQGQGQQKDSSLNDHPKRTKRMQVYKCVFVSLDSNKQLSNLFPHFTKLDTLESLAVDMSKFNLSDRTSSVNVVYLDSRVCVGNCGEHLQPLEYNNKNATSAHFSVASGYYTGNSNLSNSHSVTTEYINKNTTNPHNVASDDTLVFDLALVLTFFLVTISRLLYSSATR